ncbi:nitrite/sulfite reductase [Pseudomonas chlororaphis]|uniref:Nitrite and sulfite reductase 4Fe-4S region n=1 Tax=Pseudomonas chlororaphis TaxID=587753 RepID=A0AAX3FN17_9PSED|nr:nitrite/sulfite reductase [Pseudomonas chlororaphis]AZC37330.1 Sulfite reductase [NADPH] hemoprotein beta-component [Pseudomonas chlororaphis subsp. piscium]AZC43878.1 Sulfite reductase [NADPH] hemoprotein beta-component [Pseudomonas chlororaphis subsp. piscium]AZC63329.1 Sulfite reductase [NADPH] hemoprotein beta-component [Pseudomonas chlororaphis subsp. piscium]KZO49654.1 sulfite reductase [Pseudomonas chlororaphis subsp. piscium]MBP5071525.1 nitrite/sulfite reductase [Pseudomonas chloro
MYHYDEYDRALVFERVAQFRDQVERFMAGELSEEEFLPLRLQNGLYMQKHAYMLRVAIPYGTLSARQMRTLASIARDYDRGYGHFTTRQNMQFNWIELAQVPDILERLAGVEMHAIQTSGNCVRNITTEAFAGVAADELMDPRPLAEILRQWSTINPEFLFLPRKFKIAICSARQDRAAIMMHDIGLYLYRDWRGQMLLRVMVGGGLGRTPILSQQIRDGLPWQHLLSYVEAVLRVYNRHGRRDNKYKARIKILVKALGIEAFAKEVEEEWQHLKDGPAQLTEAEYQRVASAFIPPLYERQPATDLDYGSRLAEDPAFERWVAHNVKPHKVPGYASVVLSTKPGSASPPGDVTAAQMEAVADWSEAFGFGEIRIAHEQNIVLPDVPKSALHELWQLAGEQGLGSANVGLLTDIIACPGGDFCALANAKSIPIAQAIQARFDNLDYLHDLGDISLNISGCMNACGHHHIGNIGILGVDKNGSEWYQITLGGAQGKHSALGKVIGPSFSAEEVPGVIERIIATFVRYRESEELFVDTVQRIGLEPFKERVYPKVLEAQP